MTETKIKCHEVERFDNLMYDGCESHWHCIHCDDYWPFHCYGKKDLEQMECPARNDRTMMFDEEECLSVMSEERIEMLKKALALYEFAVDQRADSDERNEFFCMVEELSGIVGTDLHS